MERLLTANEVAEYLNVNVETLREWIKRNELNCPVYRLNGKNNYRFKQSDVDQILERARIK